MLTTGRRQAAAALALALLLWGGWALFGLPLKVRWLVSRGAPPAPAPAGEAAAGDLRALGIAAREPLVALLHGSGSRMRKAWVASLLLRAPFFAQETVEKALASADPSTARAAAFALLDGEEDGRSFEHAVGEALAPRPGSPARAPLVAWDPAPAVPVLADWLADRGDPEARFAARLLGKVPPGDGRVREALLGVVEEVPSILDPAAPPDLQLRKMVVVDALQSLLGWARRDPDVMARVTKVVAWIEDRGLSDAGWDLQAYALGLVEVSMGRGVDPSLLEKLSRSQSPIVRQRLANALETVTGEAAGRILEDLLGDESPTVRRSAVLTLRKRKDPRILALAPRLVEDSYVYVRSDTLRTIGELTGVDPEGCRAALPLLVSCLGEPWPGEPAAPGSPLFQFLESGKAEVVEAAAQSLYMITRKSPGFGKGEILDAARRTEICRALAADPERRRAVVEEWGATVEPYPGETRRAALRAKVLADRDPENVVRAMRELARLGVSTEGFPPEALERKDDDSAARNAVREWWKTGAREALREAWNGPR